MERRINKTLGDYLNSLKNNVKDQILDVQMDDEIKHKLIEFVFNYEQLTFKTEDFTKRKRTKNVVPGCERCIAKRANGEQCTRRRKDNDVSYCGTHNKGVPHGIISNTDEDAIKTQKVELWVQDIQGIMWYIDKENNVYQTEDIINNNPNPRVISKCIINSEGKYTISSNI